MTRSNPLGLWAMPILLFSVLPGSALAAQPVYTPACIQARTLGSKDGVPVRAAGAPQPAFLMRLAVSGPPQPLTLGDSALSAPFVVREQATPSGPTGRIQWHVLPAVTANRAAALSAPAGAPTPDFAYDPSNRKGAWTKAYQARDSVRSQFALQLGPVSDVFLEPNVYDPRLRAHRSHAPVNGPAGRALGAPGASGVPVAYVGSKPSWVWSKGPGFAWHLGPDYSQLTEAQNQAKSGSQTVELVHLDTGFDPNHVTAPTGRILQQCNVMDAAPDPTNIAADSADYGGLLANPGHGTATLALLTGGPVAVVNTTFDKPLGGAPFDKVHVMRMYDSVVHLETLNMAQGLKFADAIAVEHLTAGEPVDMVVSISAGGLPSAAWADEVNDLYDHGVVVVAASGNAISFIPFLWQFPSEDTVYPSRFSRVITAVGYTAAYRPYWHWLPSVMDGDFGPISVMDKAIAAPAVNTAWPRHSAQDGPEHRGATIDMDSGGTSTATPQVAAAAALWLQMYGDKVTGPSCRRFEAVKIALTQSADRSHSPYNQFQLGTGYLKAKDALDHWGWDAVAAKMSAPDWRPADKADVSNPILRVLFGRDEAAIAGHCDSTGVAASFMTAPITMEEDEAAQLMAASRRYGAFLSPGNGGGSQAERAQRAAALRERILRDPDASEPLKAALRARAVQ